MKRKEFFIDVLKCSLNSYGGPEAHYSVFLDILVKKKKYISEEELIEIMTLNSLLPGPSSTQTILTIGYKLGGILTSIITFLIWVFPSIFMLIFLSFFYNYIISLDYYNNMFKFLPAMGLGIIIFGSYTISKKMLKSSTDIFIGLFSCFISFIFNHSFTYIILISLGIVMSLIYYRKEINIKGYSINFNFKLLFGFILLAVSFFILNYFVDNKLFSFISSIFEYGYLVIGGGNAVIAFMFTEFVNVKNYVDNTTFLNGLALSQIIPGPMFSFSAYLASIISVKTPLFFRIIFSIFSGLLIFLPGIILVYFVYPVWEQLKNILVVKSIIRLITIITAGFILSAPLIIINKSNFSFQYIIFSIIVFALLSTKKIPILIIVLFTILLGIYL